MGPFLGNVGRTLRQTLLGLESFPTSLGQPTCTVPSPLQASKDGRRLASSLVRQPAQIHWISLCSPVPICEVERTTDINFIINHLVWGSALPPVNLPHPFSRGLVLKAEEDQQLSKLAATGDGQKENWILPNTGKAVSQGFAVVRRSRELEQLEESGILFYLWPSVSKLIPRTES